MQKPDLVKPRATTVGSSKLATELLTKQRAKAEAHKRAFYASHQDGHFEAFRMTRTRVPNPKQYVGQAFKKLFDDDKWYSGKIMACHDDAQRWNCVCVDGDSEDLTCTDVKQVLGPRFTCGVVRSGAAAVTTVTEIRMANRNRRLHGRSNPLDGVVAELQDVADGAEFDLPAHYVESAGTKWRLLRVYLDEKTGRQVAAYCGVDEAACIPEEDIDNLSLEDLEREHDIEVAEYSAVRAWISASKATAVVAATHSNARRSKRRQNAT